MTHVAGANTAGGSGSAGGPVSTGGVSVSVGGAQAVGGTPTMGGQTVTVGGASPDPGDGGEAGALAAGGAPACDGSYHACGCGCCAGQASVASCVYPDLGQNLDKVAADDAARKADVAGCSAAGCSVGKDYVCCAAPPPSNDGASYETSLFIGGINRVHLSKMLLPKECSSFVLQQAPPTTPADPQAFPVKLPAGWKIESIRSLPCSSSAIGPNAIGAIGDFSLHVVNGACVVTAHLAAFFNNAQLGLQTVRFDADAVPIDISVGECK